MNICRSFLAALSFLTRVYVPSSANLDEDALAHSPPLFPVVGALIGLVVAGFDRLACLAFPPSVVAVADVALGFAITAGLHLDGLMDTADGLLSGKPRERALEIMKDSRVGAMGVSVGVLTLGLKVASVAALPSGTRFEALLVAPAVGRYLMYLAMTMFPYARAGTGLGSLFKLKDRTRMRVALESAASGLFVVALVFGTTHMPGLTAFVACGLLVFAFGRSANAYLGGLTGDAYGAICEIAEAGMYVILSARWLAT